MKKMPTGKRVTIGKEGVPLEDRPTAELRFRLGMLRGVVKLLNTDPEMKNDPRQPNALKKYRRDIGILRRELERRGQLPRTKIGLKTAHLDATVPK